MDLSFTIADRIENIASRIPPLLSDVLSRLLPGDCPGIVEAGASFGCRGNVFSARCLAMDDFSGPAIPAFIRHITIRWYQPRLGFPIVSIKTLDAFQRLSPFSLHASPISSFLT
jgi:hypothetical protein